MAEAPKQPSWQVTRTMRSRARSLRRDSTDAERIIWNAVRAHRMNGVGFRRQKPIGPYVVDFVCQGAMLVIEIDGSQHASSEGDAARDAALMAEGFRVARYWNNDVLQQPASVLEDIFAKLVGR